ncbi:MAG TPA: hypothetical protein VFD11_08645 [Thiopseudomonas sp.]|nr:hypothetical protein [Thiopseudomonas sp.]
MSESNENGPLDEQADDSLAYEHAQKGKQGDDPLTAIKNMRLQQLAVCRSKSQEEMRAMHGSSQAAREKQGDPECL